jgi:hypothetical protein
LKSIFKMQIISGKRLQENEFDEMKYNLVNEGS